MNKKGQSMSVNVIIVAVLALVVLVVLVAMFISRVGFFEKGVSKESQTELAKMKISYGSCHPGQSLENIFSTSYGAAEIAEDKDFAISNFRSEIERCKGFSQSKEDCEAESGCAWN